METTFAVAPIDFDRFAIFQVTLWGSPVKGPWCGMDWKGMTETEVRNFLAKFDWPYIEIQNRIDAADEKRFEDWNK